MNKKKKVPTIPNSSKAVILVMGVFNPPIDDAFFARLEELGEGKIIILGVFSDKLLKDTGNTEIPLYKYSSRVNFLLKFQSSTKHILELDGDVYGIIEEKKPSILVIPESARSDPNFGIEQITEKFRGTPMAEMQIVVL
jgi:hypothetical protein